METVFLRRDVADSKPPQTKTPFVANSTSFDHIKAEPVVKNYNDVQVQLLVVLHIHNFTLLFST